MNDQHIYDEEIDKKICKLMTAYDQSRYLTILIDDGEMKKFLIERSYQMAIREMRLIINRLDS